MLFGVDKEYGLMQEGFGLKVVKLGENGVTEKDILVHDAHCMDNTLQLNWALMEDRIFQVALGVIRDVEALLMMTLLMHRLKKWPQRKNIIISRNY